jgi:N-methylhydantoinase B
LRRDYGFPDSEASFTILSDRDRWGPHGLFGGQPGRVAQYVLLRGDQEIALGSKTTVQLEPGDIISFRTCGGGGYGPPAERDPQAVLDDVRDGKVSVESARNDYRVVIDAGTSSVSEVETAKLRRGE